MTDRPDDRVPRPAMAVTMFIVVVIVVAVVGVAVSWGRLGPPSDPVAFVTLAVLGILSVRLREPDVGSRINFSFLSIVVIASVVLVGPVGCALVGALSMAAEPGRPPTRVRAFNVAMSATLGVVGGWVYLLVGGATDLTAQHGAADLLTHVGIPLMIADAAQMLVNAALLAGIVTLSDAVPIRRFFVQIVSNSGVAYIGYGFIGFLFVVLWVPADVGPFSAVLILAPLFVARWAFVQFGEEQRAHERTLNALVTAVETKDPYASGHSARIARLAEWMAEPLSISAQDVQSLRFAAMLHDVGKVGVPTRLLRRRSSESPTRADLDAIAQHPKHGVELVRGIDFLEPSLDGILHHHERWDGEGYPDRLAAAAIPLFSRVIAVADAFDALTTHRPERPALPVSDALTELRALAGSQLDPQVVEALAAALERHDWVPAAIPDDQLDRMHGYLDHDHPRQWERARRAVDDGAQPEPAPRHEELHLS